MTTKEQKIHTSVWRACSAVRHVAAACFLFCAAANASPPPKFTHLKDYMVPMHCDPFSKAALAYLDRLDVPAVRITYGWSQFGGGRNFHAAVLFKWEGKYFFMDNGRMGPRPVAGKTDLGCVNRVTQDWQTMCWMVNEDNERIAPRKLEELFEAERLLRAYRRQSR